MRLHISWAVMIALASCSPVMIGLDAGADAGTPDVDAGLPSCLDQHTDGDEAEPDECPALAHLITPGRTFSRTLNPVGDQDWFRVEARARHAYRFSTENLSTYVWVFDSNGHELATRTNSVLFVLPERTTLFIRVRSTANGAYLARLEDFGLDDYLNNEWEAEQVAPETGFHGELTYAEDVDVAWLEIPPLTTLDFKVTGEVKLELKRADGSSLELIGNEEGDGGIPPGRLRVSIPLAERVQLKVSGLVPQATGPFSVETSVFATDDHADVPAFATPIIANGPSIEATQQGGGLDVDLLSSQQIAGHLYNVQVNGPPDSVLVFDSSGMELADNRRDSPHVWKAIRTEPISFALRCPTTCTITFEDLGFDDHGDDAASATRFPGPSTLAGRLELSTDVDVFAFQTVAGHVMRVSYAVQAALRVEVRDAQGTLQDPTFLTASNQTFTLSVQRDFGSPLSLIRYQLKLEDFGPDDHGNTPATATPLTIGTAVAGLIELRGDVDVFAVPVVQGRIYRATSSAGYVYLWDANGLIGGGASPFLFYAATSAPRFVSISGAFGAYTLVVADVGVDDHADTPAAATPITPGTQATGVTQFPMDLDAFKLSVTPGHRYSVVCTAAWNDCLLRLAAISSTGSTTASGPFWEKKSILAEPNQTEEIITVDAQDSLTYTLLVTDLGADDHPDTPALATTEIVIGGAPVTGSSELYDPDVFFIDAVAGQVIRLTCTESLNSGCNLIMRPQNGSGLSTVSPNTAPEVVTSGFFSPTTQRWTVTVTSGESRVDYSLSATSSADDNTAPRSMTLGTQVTGSIDYVGDVDEFTLQLTQGVPVTLSLTGAVGVRAYSPSGCFLPTLSDGSRLVPCDTGLYRVEVWTTLNIGSYSFAFH